MHAKTDYVKPAHVPSELFISGNIWGEWGAEPREAFKQLLNGRDLVFLQEHYHAGHSSSGTWLVASAEGNRQVLFDTETFTSGGVKIFSRLLGGDLIFFPVELDPPLHGKYRAIISPYFTPTAVAELKDVITKRVDEMLDVVVPKGQCEFVSEFGNLFPASIFLDIVGLPRSRLPEFLTWAHTGMGDPDPANKRAAMQKIGDYLMSEILLRRDSPTDDLLSRIINSEINGRPVTPEEATGCAVVLFLGGLDTVATQLGWVFRRLGEDREFQDQLRREPERIPQANEELLRFFSSVLLTRQATRDTELMGVTIKAGDLMACCLPMANHDEREFRQPEMLDMNRNLRNHMAFGYGAHFCVGLRLARLELNIVVERWLARVRDFRLAPGYEAKSYVGNVFKLRSVPLVWS